MSQIAFAMIALIAAAAPAQEEIENLESNQEEIVLNEGDVVVLEDSDCLEDEELAFIEEESEDLSEELASFVEE